MTEAVTSMEPSGTGGTEVNSEIVDFVGAVSGTRVQLVVPTISAKLAIAQPRQDARNARAIIRKQA
jgi:hypothetical protein